MLGRLMTGVVIFVVIILWQSWFGTNFNNAKYEELTIISAILFSGYVAVTGVYLLIRYGLL